MYVVCVTAQVRPGSEEAFLAATLENARRTRQEPGNVRFDVLQGEDDPARFFLYEVYHSQEDFQAHQRTDHYLRWREAVAPMMAEPRRGVRYHSRFPDEKDW